MPSKWMQYKHCTTSPRNPATMCGSETYLVEAPPQSSDVSLHCRMAAARPRRPPKGTALLPSGVWDTPLFPLCVEAAPRCGVLPAAACSDGLLSHESCCRPATGARHLRGSYWRCCHFFACSLHICWGVCGVPVAEPAVQGRGDPATTIHDDCRQGRRQRGLQGGQWEVAAERLAKSTTQKLYIIHPQKLQGYTAKGLLLLRTVKQGGGPGPTLVGM